MRKLSVEEIEYILDFLTPNKTLPHSSAVSITTIIKNKLKKQLENVMVKPVIIPQLKKEISSYYFSSLISPCECVGVALGQNIGWVSTQSTLNTFHKAGMTDKTTTESLPRLEEILSCSKYPKNPSCFIHFKEKITSISKIRKVIGSSLVEIYFQSLIADMKYSRKKDDEYWFEAFSVLYKKPIPDLPRITVLLKKEIVFKYSLTLLQICKKIEENYEDLFCVFSPSNLFQIDIFLDTNVKLNKEVLYITEENKDEIYFSDVVRPRLENILICGIEGIKEIYFCQENDNSFFLETTGSNLKKVLALPYVDISKTYSSNLHEIYEIFGIRATYNFLLKEFSQIVEGINPCHLKLICSWMCFYGIPSSLSRYTIKSNNYSVLHRAAFEESLSNLLNSGVFCETEDITNTSATIICGKRPMIGSNGFEISLDMEKLKEIKK